MAAIASFEKLRLEKVFAVLALLFGVVVVFVTPPFQAADEYNHFTRAYQVSEFKLISETRHVVPTNNPDLMPYQFVFIYPNTTASGGMLPRSVAATFEKCKGLEFHPEKKQDVGKVFELVKLPLNPEDKTFIHFTNTTVYSPVVYLPQAVGIGAGRLLNLSPLVLMYLGRLGNLAAWATLVFLAIRVMPVYKPALLVLALTPMSIFQASSLSADAVTNAACFCFVALVLRLMVDGDASHRTKYHVSLLLLSFVIALSKIVYMPMLLILLFVPGERFPQGRKALWFILLLVSSGVLNLTWSQLVKDLYVPYNEGSSPQGQMQFILGDLWNYAKVVGRSMELQLLTSFIGCLGWVDTYFPLWFYFLYYLVILLLMLDGSETLKLDLRDRALLLGIAVCSTVLTITAVYVYSMPVGEVQSVIVGRYFIPLSPLIFLIFAHGTGMRIPEGSKKTIVSAFSLFSLVMTVVVLVGRYY